MGPFVFFDCVTHFGGSNHSTVLIIKEMQRHCDVVVLDAYGTCKEYHEALKSHGIKTTVIQPNPKRPYIGGLTRFERLQRFVASTPEMIDLVRRLRRALEHLSPRAIWTNGRKALFLLSRAVDSHYPLAYYARGENMYPRWSTMYDWRRISLIAGISESCLARLRGSPYEAAIMEVVPNGIDVNEAIEKASDRAVDLPSDTGLRLIYPASIGEIKDQATAIRGLADYVNDGGDASLWLCGDVGPGNSGAYLNKLHKLVDDLNLREHVHFLGWRNNVFGIMAQCDIAVLTSVTEGFGRVLLEAMCMRKPVIATRVGGIPEVVQDGVEGILIDAKDSRGFARAIEKLADVELRHEMGQAGFERVSTKYDIKMVAARFLELMTRISGGHMK